MRVCVYIYMSDDELTHSNGAFPKGGPVKNNKELEESRATARPDPTGPDQTRTTNDGIRSKTEQRWLNFRIPTWSFDGGSDSHARRSRISREPEIEKRKRRAQREQRTGKKERFLSQNRKVSHSGWLWGVANILLNLPTEMEWGGSCQSV